MASYTLYSWLRQGLGSSSTSNVLELSTEVIEKKDAGTEVKMSGPTQLIKLAGPSIVQGINKAAIKKKHPHSDATSFNSEYLSFIEFHEADFPWRFTLAASDKNKLFPWLFLLTLTEEEFSEAGIVNRQSFIQLKEVPSIYQNENLKKDAVLWAHVQSFNSDDSENDHARIISPRQLEKGKTYHNFLVSLYSTNEDSKDGKKETVRDLKSSSKIPYFYRWKFSTTQAPSFGDLKDQLESGAATKTDEEQKKENKLPLIDCRELFLDTSSEKFFEMPTLLFPMDTVLKPISLNNTNIKKSQLPKYGSKYGNDKKPWFVSINNDPRYRVITQFGIQLVREHQEEWVDLIWNLVETFKEDSALYRKALFAATISNKLHNKHIKNRSFQSLLTFTRPIHTKIAIDSVGTVDAHLKNSLQSKASAEPTSSRLIRKRKKSQLDFKNYEKTTNKNQLYENDNTLSNAEDLLTQSYVDRLKKIKEGNESAKQGINVSTINFPLKQALLPELPIADFSDYIDNNLTIDISVFDYFRKYRPDLILPNTEDIPNNSISLYKIHQQFIECILLGMNEEISRELLWREVPIGLKNTLFRKFWDHVDFEDFHTNKTAQNIHPINDWQEELGKNTINSPSIVILIRADIIRQYPEVIIYAKKDSSVEFPLFRELLDRHTLLVGINLTKANLEQEEWSLIITERPGALEFEYKNDEPKTTSAQWAAHRIKKPDKVTINLNGLL